MWQVKETDTTLLVRLFVVIVLYLAIGGSAAAATIYVEDNKSANYTTIQAAVNNANSGDEIIIKPGIYTENVGITVNGLTIASESGDSNDTIVEAANSSYVFSVWASEVNISDLSIKGTGSSGGITFDGGANSCKLEKNEISDCKIAIDINLYCTENSIVNNKISNCGEGISITESMNNKLDNNIITNCSNGIDTYSLSYFNTISNNTISNCKHGISVQEDPSSNLLENNSVTENEVGISLSNLAQSNTLINNKIEFNKECGLKISNSYSDNLTSNNQIYNNYFNNTVNVESGPAAGVNIWNTTKTKRENIIGGPYTGGNYWATPAEDGFSQTYLDVNGDGFAEEPYYLNEWDIDYMPLVTHGTEPVPVSSNAIQTNVTPGTVPLTVLFTEMSQNITSRS